MFVITEKATIKTLCVNTFVSSSTTDLCPDPGQEDGGGQGGEAEQQLHQLQVEDVPRRRDRVRVGGDLRQPAHLAAVWKNKAHVPPRLAFTF